MKCVVWMTGVEEKVRFRKQSKIALFCSRRTRAFNLVDLDDNLLAIPLSALSEPFAHREGKARGIDMKACFKFPFAGRQSIVEFRGAGEIPHAEIVQPFQWHWLAVDSSDYFRIQLSRVHFGKSIASCTFSANREVLILLFHNS